ncbi:unnamed protein product [Paramecium primaurelia]|uniref:Uncharacterized protein n=1 Tax=Paramecium primaurelia TaxID=5886 RepID=A0A8S1PL69_PARPR|nr:unnamed protein product [Paramecium primaurelia]
MNQKKLDQVIYYLKYINVFVKPVDLFLLKQGGHRTLLGTFMTLGIISVLLIQFINIVSSFVLHDNPTLLTNQSYSQQQPPIYLSKENFTITISSLNYDLGDSYNISMTLVSQLFEDKTNSKMTTNIQKTNIPLIKCQQQQGLPDYFVNTSLIQYCIDWESVPYVIIEGSLDSDYYKYIEVSINQCEETSKCPFIQSDEIIIKTLSTYADTMNFNQPHQLYGKTFKNVINQYYTKRFNGIFQITEVKQDHGYILQELETTKSLSINNLYENFDSQDEKVYATYRFYLDNLTQIYQISYPKIQQSLSDFGGLCEIFIIAALIIVTPLNELSYKVTLLNELFNFNLNNQTQNGQQQQKIHPSNTAKQRLKSIQLKTSQLERINRQMTVHGRNSEKNDHKFLINALQDSIKRFFDERNSKLELSFCDYIPCARGKKQQLISYSMSKINNSLDITYIVKKLQEIDKLKMILLSPDQIKLFDFLPKPNIDLNSNDKQSYFSILKPEQSELEKAIEAQTAFNNLAKFKDDQINQHLVEFLDDDIISLFRINMKKEVKSLTNFSPVTQTHFLSDLPSRMPQIEQQDDSDSESSPSIKSIQKLDQ